MWQLRRMLKVVKSKEMKELDGRTVAEIGIPSIELMENAATAVADKISEFTGGFSKKRALVLCGPGNNGGDGAAISRLLIEQGAFVTSVLPRLESVSESTASDAQKNFKRLHEIIDERLNIIGIESGVCEQLEKEYDFIVDSLFGTGLSRPIEGKYAELIEWINERHESGIEVYSVDLPSGLDADNNELIGVAVNASQTITFTAPKLANVLAPASFCNGVLHCVEIGTPRSMVNDYGEEAYVTEAIDLKNWLSNTSFQPGSYKKTRGSLLIIAGSRNYTGAAVIAANAAMRSGTGLVTLAVPESIIASVSPRVLPEIIVRGFPETIDGSFSIAATDAVKRMSSEMDAILIGCGLGRESSDTKRFIEAALQIDGMPMLIDADGLFALGHLISEIERSAETILTPHFGEIWRLCGRRFDESESISMVRQLATRSGANVLLKGDTAIIGSPEGKVAFNLTGTPSVGKGGSGDSLAGLLTGMLAQAGTRIPVFETISAGMYFAGLAAENAEARCGARTMLASDVIESFSEIFEEFEGQD